MPAYAIQFVGASSQSISTPVVTALTGDLTVTLAMRVKMTNTGTFQAICSIGDASFALEVLGLFYNFRGTNVISVEFGGGNGAWSNTPTPITPGVYYDIAIKKTPGAINATTRIFVDGVDLGTLDVGSSASTPNINNSVGLEIGGMFGSGTFLTGEVDWIALYSTAISDGNISSLAAGSITPESLSGAEYIYEFPEGTGILTADSSGNGRTAQLINGPTWVQLNDPINTAARNAASLIGYGMPYLHLSLPFPVTTIDQGDKQHLVGLYRLPLANPIIIVTAPIAYSTVANFQYTISIGTIDFQYTQPIGPYDF